MKRQLRLFLSAVQMLTRVPVPDPGWEPDRLARAARFYPLVGLLLGGAAALLHLGLSALLPSAAAAGLTLAALALATGALHEDGLADAADGLFGGRTPERALEIMRDSRIGAFGAVALVFGIGLRWSALAALPPAAGALALLAALPAGRAGIVLILARGRYARAESAGVAAQGAGGTEFALALATAAAAALLAGWAGLAGLGLALLLAYGLMRWTARRIGGYTGDVLGAAEQAGTTGALLVIAGAA